jgi:hypothetical protein
VTQGEWEVVAILGTQSQRVGQSDDEVDHMRRVVSYVHRHRAQKPSGDVEDLTWRYSLMNWGHDPLK